MEGTITIVIRLHMPKSNRVLVRVSSGSNRRNVVSPVTITEVYS